MYRAYKNESDANVLSFLFSSREGSNELWSVENEGSANAPAVFKL